LCSGVGGCMRLIVGSLQKSLHSKSWEARVGIELSSPLYPRNLFISHSDKID
jgi:hypothetical protein